MFITFVRNRFCVAGVMFLIVILLLNIFTPEYMDDYLYKYQFVNGIADTNYPIENLSDIFRSQLEHYKVFNGRVVVHFFVQLFTGILGKPFFNIINTLVLFLFVYLLVKVTMINITLFRFVLVNLFLLLLMPPFSECFLWMSGSINYLWVGCTIFLYLYILLRLQYKKLSLKYWFYGFFAIILGWSHEGIVFPLALSSFLYYFFMFIKKRSLSAVFPFVLFFLLGSLFCAFSPATMSRGGFDSGFTISAFIYKIITGICLIFRLKSFWFLIFICLLAYYTKKLSIQIFLKDNLILVGAIIISFGVALISGFSTTRVAFGLELYSLILALKVLSKFRIHVLLKKLVVTIYVLLMTGILYYAFLGWKKNSVLFADIKQTTNGVIVYDELRVPSIFSTYILKPLVTQNSGYYHAYSFTSWENEYIASAYGKDSLAFFPSKFIEEIKDGNSFRDFKIQDSLPFYYKQIDENQKIAKVRYVLKKPLDSEIPFYYRPFAQRMERYSAQYIDSEDFDIQYVNGHCLIFVKKKKLLSDRLIQINFLK